MKKELLILIPAYNEEDSLELFLNRLDEAKIDEIADILLINDGSSDHTEEIARRFNITVFNLVINMGYGSALQVGYKYATNKGYEYVIQLDADGQHDICNIKTIYAALISQDELTKKTPDIVIGSRFLAKSKGFEISMAKGFAIGFFRTMIRMVTKTCITDPTSGLQGLNRRTFSYYAEYGNFDYKYPDINMIIQMIMQGFYVKEIPAVMHERMAGESMHAGIIKPFKYMVIMMLSTISIIIRNRKHKGIMENERYI